MVEFSPATFFVWVLCSGWLFGLPYKMPNFSKLESQLYEYLTMRAKKKLVIHFFRYLVYEIFLWPESWRGFLHIYLLSFPRFWTLSIERFWFLFWSILNGVILKTSNIQSLYHWIDQNKWSLKIKITLPFLADLSSIMSSFAPADNTEKLHKMPFRIHYLIDRRTNLKTNTGIFC